MFLEKSAVNSTSHKPLTDSPSYRIPVIDDELLSLFPKHMARQTTNGSTNEFTLWARWEKDIDAPWNTLN